MSGYLFVHFTGESEQGEQISFSLSRDGLFWKDLQKGEPILYSNLGEKGVRDPFLVKNEKTGKYYLIATDLRIASGKGWHIAQYNGSRSLIIWESEDLVHWSGPRMQQIGVEGSGCVWAPEALYLEDRDEFFVFWASMIKLDGDVEAKQRIYASYTKDFREFTAPEIFVEKENHIIDSTMVKQGDVYYRFSKDETVKCIILEKSKTLNKDDFVQVHAPLLSETLGVEGPEIYKLPDGTWCLIVDQFATNGGYVPFLCKDLDTGEFYKLTKEEFFMGGSKKRHGGVIMISDEEYDRLEQAYGQLNPVLSGLYADPDIVKFEDTYYIYPTTDGYDGWSGTNFYVFSSKDGRHFARGRKILDVSSSQVSWATGSAWAPCIASSNGRYYFYFCAKDKNGVSAIGVAYGDHPQGPFTACDEPLITMELMRAYGISMGQTIDPSVYQENGESWLLFGNGHAAIVKLGEDMISIQPETLKNLEGAYDFRESIIVFKRDGKYHFTWSCDDTGSENYHVNYGISDNLYGPIEYQYPVLEKDQERQILGTGHHSIMRDTDGTYRIAYHRFGRPLERYPEGKGYHRETCVGVCEFTENGLLKRIVTEE